MGDPFSGLTLVSAPASDPVTVADAKAQSRVFIGADDVLLAGYIRSATLACEAMTRRAFMPQSWRYTLSHFPGRNPQAGYRLLSGPDEYYRYNHFEIPKPPLVSVDSFTYTDTVGTVYNMTQGYGSQAGNYLLDLESEPGRVVLPFGGIWPTTILLPGSPIQVTYTCGYLSWTGILSIGNDGMATLESGDNFDQRLAGSWIGIGGCSFQVSAVVDASHLRLVIPTPNSLPVPAKDVVWTGNAVPMPVRHAILQTVAHMYENREPVAVGRGETAVEIPMTVDHLLASYRV